MIATGGEKVVLITDNFPQKSIIIRDGGFFASIDAYQHKVTILCNLHSCSEKLSTSIATWPSIICHIQIFIIVILIDVCYNIFSGAIKCEGEEGMASIKCTKCGEIIKNVTEGSFACPKCGHKMRFGSNGRDENGTKKKKNAKKKTKKNGNKTLGIVAIVVLSLGILSMFLPNTKKGEKTLSSSSIWAKSDTKLKDFEYYIDGDKININGYEGRGKKVKIGKSYSIDGKDMDVVSVSDAPFLGGGDIDSAIISEGITTLDANTFNSCGVKYVFLPSTLQNVDNRFWGYFFETEKIYFGGTQEQWNAICTVAREDIDCKQIYCNVKVEELGEDDSKKEMVSMDATPQDETQPEGESGAGATDGIYGNIEDFSYNIHDNIISLRMYLGDENTIEIRPSYIVDGVEYQTDISEFVVTGMQVNTIIFDEGFTELERSAFSGSRINRVFFPHSMTNIYDQTLGFLYNYDEEIKQIYYAGTQEEWNAIFRHYERTKVEDAWNTGDGAEIGEAIGDKAFEVLGVEYHPEYFEYHFSANPEELK